MESRFRAVAGLLFAALSFAPVDAAADLTFEVVYTDAADSGFNDPAPYTGAGAAGQTLGEERRAALHIALDTWAATLSSDVPVVVEASYEDLGCTGPLARGTPGGFAPGTWVPGGAEDRMYPSALANRLNGLDVYPAYSDLIIEFNSAACAGPWSYSIGVAGTEDFVTVALHEIAHGLGFVSLLDETTGEWTGDLPDRYSANIVSLLHNKYLHELNAQERLLAITTARNLVWGGAAVLAVVDQYLVPGSPSLWTEPTLAGLSGRVVDSNFGSRPLDQDIAGEILADYTCTAPSAVAGRIYLPRVSCSLESLMQSVEGAGGLGVLVAGFTDPPWPHDQLGVAAAGIPLLGIIPADYNILVTAIESAPVVAHLSFDSAQRVGADAQGRPYLLSGDPSQGLAVIAHWDPLVREDLLMESSTELMGRTLDLTVQAMVDIGWNVCGDGTVTLPERCDDGATNGSPASCPADCSVQVCGNGQQEGDEACDEGEANSDIGGGDCRTDCTLPRCGDGELDDGETCDWGWLNSDTDPGSCRTDCTLAECGNGQREEAEECDEGDANGDVAGAACRADCTLPRCGDGVHENSEPCDWGSENSDGEPDACRVDCSLPGCGDGVVDTGEDCDSGDDGQSRGCVECRSVGRTEAAPDAGAPDDAEHAVTDSSGCGCRTGRSHRSAAAGARWALVGVLLVALGLRGSQRRRLRSLSNGRHSSAS